MSRTTVYGSVADELGDAAWGWTGDVSGTFHVSEVRAHPAGAADRCQPHHIDVRAGSHHGPVVGEVVALDHHGPHLIAVAVIAAHDPDVLDLADGRWYMSANVVAQHRNRSAVATRWRIDDHIAIVRTPAGVAMTPITVVPGDLRYLADHELGANPHDRQLLTRARQSARRHQLHAGPLVIDRSPEPATLDDRHGNGLRPSGPIEHSAPFAGILSVR